MHASIKHDVAFDNMQVQHPQNSSLKLIISLPCTGEGQGSDGMLLFHKFGRDVIYSRFEKLRAALSGCPHLKLQNPPSSPGAYAWIHCEGEVTCEDVFAKVNLTGFSGKSFGTTEQG